MDTSRFDGVFTEVVRSIALPCGDEFSRVMPDFSVDDQKAARLQRSKWVGVAAVGIEEPLNTEVLTEYTAMVRGRLMGRQAVVTFTQDELDNEIKVYFAVAHNRESAYELTENVARAMRGSLRTEEAAVTDFTVCEYEPSELMQQYLDREFPQGRNIADLTP